MKPGGIEKTENPESKTQQNPEQTVSESTQEKIDDIMDEGETKEQKDSKRTEQKTGNMPKSSSRPSLIIILLLFALL